MSEYHYHIDGAEWLKICQMAQSLHGKVIQVQMSDVNIHIHDVAISDSICTLKSHQIALRHIPDWNG